MNALVFATAALAALGACEPVAAGAAAAPATERGRTIATEACASCHRVTAAQPLPPPVADPNEETTVPAPSFFAIARTHGGDPAYLRKAILTPHYPMREQDWTRADLDAVVAYIQSLQKGAP